MSTFSRQISAQQAGWRSLSVQLLALIVLPLMLIVLAITVVSTSLHQRAMRDLVGARDERIAQMAARAIADHMAARERAVIGLAGQVTPEADLQAILDRSAHLDAVFDLGLFALDRQGNLLAARGLAGELLRSDSAAAAQAARGLAPGWLQPDWLKPMHSSMVGSVGGPERSLHLVFMPAPGGDIMLGGGFYVDLLAMEVLRAAFSPEQSAAALLLSADGQVLYQQNFVLHGTALMQHPGVPEALAGRTGRAYADAHNGEHVVAYTTVQGLGWVLLIEEPWEQVANPLLEMTHLAPLAMVPVLLLALFALLFGFRQIVHPLQSLSKQAGSLGWGDYSAIEKPVGGIEEIHLLQQELIRMARKLKAAQHSLHSYIGAITTGQEEERRRLARELHDETIQSLIALKHRIQLAQMDWDGHPVEPALGKLELAAEQTIENVRRMVSALRPIYLEDLGLVAALNMMASELEQSAGGPIFFTSKGKERRLDPAVELAIYRIVQEALRNIVRHSEATQSAVTLTFQAGCVTILVEDNGKGFRVPANPAEFAPGGHFGLLGMYERAELIGASLKVQSAPGQGSSLLLEVTGD